jgi:hypothetical protein
MFGLLPPWWIVQTWNFMYCEGKKLFKKFFVGTFDILGNLAFGLGIRAQIQERNVTRICFFPSFVFALGGLVAH